MTDNPNGDDATIRRLREVLLVEEELPLGARSRMEASLAKHHRRSLVPSSGSIAVVASLALAVTLLVRAVPLDGWSMGFVGLCALAYGALLSRSMRTDSSTSSTPQAC